MLIRKPLDIGFACCCVPKSNLLTGINSSAEAFGLVFFPVALVKDCGTKTDGKCFSAQILKLWKPKSSAKIYLQHPKLSSIQTYVVASLYCNSENAIGRKAFDSTINLSLQLESSIK